MFDSLKVKRITLITLPFLLAFVSSIQAQIYTYGVIRNTSGPEYTSSLQEVKLSNVSINVTPCGSYLKITERAVIKSVASAENVSRTWIEGTLRLPEKSTITSFSIVSDTNAFVAKVQPATTTSSEIDTTRGKLIASLKAGQQEVSWTYDYYTGLNRYTTRTSFILKIDTTACGQEYNTVLTYLVPNTGIPNATYNLEVMHHCNNIKPGVFEFTFSSDSSAMPYTLTVNNMTFQLKDKQSIQVPYQRSFIISAKSSASTIMHTTKFSEKSWSGSYLLLNTAIPDTVMRTLSKAMEMVVLWRWNNPKQFSYMYNNEFYQSDNRYMSNYGYQAMEQGYAIRYLATNILSAGSKIGLVHSIQNDTNKVFPLCNAQSSDYARLDSYLAQFDESYFINSNYFYYQNQTTPQDTNHNVKKDTSGREFISSMKIIQGLYSNNEGVLKHLIILSCGPIAASSNIITLDEVENLLSETTVDCSNAAWTDVNFTNVKMHSRQEQLINYANFMVPEFQPHSLMLSVANNNKVYQFPISPNQASFSIIAKSSDTWIPELTWTGYTTTGETMSSVITSVKLLQPNQDTGLVKLWAANNERLSETLESNIDKNYGVVSESNCLKIFPTYKTYAANLPTYAEMEPVYAPDTNTVANKASAGADKTAVSEVSKKLVCTLSGCGLRIIAPGNESISRIRIFSLSGQLLLEINPQQFSNAGGYLIPVSFLQKHIAAKSTVVLQIKAVKGFWNRQLFIQ